MVNQTCIDVIVNFQHSAPIGIWIHEKVICRLLPTIESLSPHKVLTNAIAIFKKGSYTDAAGVKFVVTQGTLAQHNIHIETHGVREEFSPSVLGDSTPTKRVPW